MEPAEPAHRLALARTRTVRLRSGLIALVLLLVGAAALWTWREQVITKLGDLLVEETPPAPADLVAVFDNEVPGPPHPALSPQWGRGIRMKRAAWRERSPNQESSVARAFSSLSPASGERAG